MPRASFTLVVVLAASLLHADERSRFADLDFEIERPFVAEKGRADGTRVFNTQSGTSLAARLFFAEGKPAKLWAAKDATPPAETEYSDLQIRSMDGHGGRVWHEVSYHRPEKEKDGRIGVVTTVTDCGPFLVEIHLVGSAEDVAEKHWALERARNRIRFGPLAALDTRDWRLGEASDLVGNWSMRALETAGVPRDESPLRFPFQRFEIAAGGSWRHLAHTSELSAEVRERFASRSLRFRWTLETPGLVAVRRGDSEARADEHVALVLEPREEILESAGGILAAKDMLLIVRTSPDQPALARLLRRDAMPTTAEAEGGESSEASGERVDEGSEKPAADDEAAPEDSAF